ncbi:hypothetical protein M440DRAFT_240496 [Trichoderma longibrachiatum ATCC 18648]|uniref:Uncharacterized protein n=1 Tax=Trichoderma longibrachiatum ATCC 18648 TaxID=983965 RepID=A0A2T4CDB5_TRILO|nr:hypothetical protein M440DRAFT_240496 [Trichoderma longibrachiatum ATCC 18648]
MGICSGHTKYWETLSHTKAVLVSVSQTSNAVQRHPLLPLPLLVSAAESQRSSIQQRAVSLESTLCYEIAIQFASVQSSSISVSQPSQPLAFLVFLLPWPLSSPPLLWPTTVCPASVSSSSSSSPQQQQQRQHRYDYLLSILQCYHSALISPPDPLLQRLRLFSLCLFLPLFQRRRRFILNPVALARLCASSLDLVPHFT